MAEKLRGTRVEPAIVIFAKLPFNIYVYTHIPGLISALVSDAVYLVRTS